LQLWWRASHDSVLRASRYLGMRAGEYAQYHKPTGRIEVFTS
jgi:hypothetical protein